MKLRVGQFWFVLLLIVVVLLSGCASKRRSPEMRRYQSYCFFKTDGLDADTAAYWKQLCEMSGGEND